MAKKYGFRVGARVSGVTADVLGTELERMHEQYAGVTPDRVVKEAKPKRAALHDAFEWDDTKAGHEHRLLQARNLIRSVQVTIEDRDPVSVFCHVQMPTDDGAVGMYRTMDVIVTDPDLFGIALGELRAKLTGAARSVKELETLLANTKPLSPRRRTARVTKLRTAGKALSTATSAVGRIK